MMDLFKNLFSSAPKVDLAPLIKAGATILDVRSQGEYAGGHIKGSVNIPLNILETQLPKLKKDKTIITCCASGMRSASAKNILQSHGFAEVHNGGSWVSLKQYEQ